MLSRAVRAACEGLRAAFIIVGARNPPRNPFAEGVVVAIRRRVVGRCGSDVPGHLRVGKAAASIISRRHACVGVAPDDVWALARLCRDLKLGATKLLHLKIVREGALYARRTAAARSFKLNHRIA